MWLRVLARFAGFRTVFSGGDPVRGAVRILHHEPSPRLRCETSPRAEPSWSRSGQDLTSGTPQPGWPVLSELVDGGALNPGCGSILAGGARRRSENEGAPGRPFRPSELRGGPPGRRSARRSTPRCTGPSAVPGRRLPRTRPPAARSPDSTSTQPVDLIYLGVIPSGC